MRGLALALSCPACGFEFSRSDINDLFVYECRESGIAHRKCPGCDTRLVFERTIVDSVKTEKPASLE